jgi:hypothetical protein
MELFRHELYKVFGRKIVWLVLLFFVILTGFSSLSQCAQITHDYGDLRQYYSSTYKGKEGRVDSALIKKAERWVKQSDASYVQKFMTGKATVTETRQANFYTQVLFPQGLMADRTQQIKVLQKQLKKTAQASGLANYNARSRKLQIEMLKKLNLSGLYFTLPLLASLDFPGGLGFCLMFVLVLLGISPVFTDEYTSNMDSLILSAKKGRKAVVSAKIAATALYCGFAGLIIPLANFCYQISALGFAGWNAPLQMYYQSSPYALTLGTFLLTETLIGVIACVFFGLLVLLVSALSKNVMVPFFACGCLVVLTTLIKTTFSAMSPKALMTFADFSYSELLRTQGLFENFKAYNIFGFPVLYLNLILMIYTIVTVIVVYLIYRLFPKHQV